MVALHVKIEVMIPGPWWWLNVIAILGSTATGYKDFFCAWETFTYTYIILDTMPLSAYVSDH